MSQNIQRSLQSFCVSTPIRQRVKQLDFVHPRLQLLQKSLGNVSKASTHASKSGQICDRQHSHNGTIAPAKRKIKSECNFNSITTNKFQNWKIEAQVLYSSWMCHSQKWVKLTSLLKYILLTLMTSPLYRSCVCSLSWQNSTVGNRGQGRANWIG